MSKIRAIAFLLLCAPVPAFAATQPLVVSAGSDCGSTATTSTSIGGALSKVGDGGIIYVRPGTYTEHLTISSKTVTIQGRASDCSGSGAQNDPSPVAGPADSNVETVIDGGGNGTVFTLNNFVNIYLSDVRITHGYTSGDGGGISFTGGGGLNLTHTIVENNTANRGGGIAVVPAASVVVNIWDGTLIQNNMAGSSNFDGDGGGVFLDSQLSNSNSTDVRFFMTHRNTSIFNNTAKIHGGGLYVGRKVEADIGSPGYFGYFGTPTYAYAGAIEDNQATAGGGGGGGIYLDKGSVRLYSTQAHEPVRIAGNSSVGSYGGGIFATVQSHICGWGYSINRNGAYQGAAIWAEGASGVDLIKGDLNQCNVDTDMSMNIAEDGTKINNPQHFVDCAVGDICNEINSNGTESTDPASGAPLGIIHIIGAGSSFKAERLQIRGNSRTAVLSAEASAGASLENCLIADNYAGSTNSSESLVWANTALTVKGCTVAGNAIQSSTQIVFAISNGSLTLTNSIVAQPTATLAGYDTASTRTISDVIHETNAIVNGTNVKKVTVPPGFVDPTYGNYYLKPTSPGIDYTANCTPGTDTDLFGNSRGVPTISGSSATPCDIGAYERQKGPAAATFPYNENFDELDPFAAEVPAGWVNTVTMVDPTLVSTTPGWGSTTASPYLGPMAMHAIEPGYESDSYLATPSFTVVSSGVVTFWHQFDLEYTYGGVALDISLDGGTSYNDILDPAAPGKFLSGGYSTPALQTGCGMPPPSLAGKPAWTGDSAGYQKVVVLLPAAANKKSVMLRWHLGSDCSGQHNGYWLDSLHVEPNDTIFANGFN